MKKTYFHIKTRSNNVFSHGMRVQKTYLLSLIHMYQLFSEDYILTQAHDVAGYILSHKRKNGLFIDEAPMGLAQEEGPATAGVIQAFCEMYGLIKDKQYLIDAMEAAYSAKNYLKDPQYGYLHTLGYRENTTNVNASFAWAYTMLFSYTGEEAYKNEAENCLENVFAMQDSSGLFMYSTNNETIYISLYHFLVIIALIKINKVFQSDLIAKSICRALEFGETLIRNDGTVIEPEAKGRYSVFQSASRAALAFYLSGNEQLGMKITKAMSNHFLNGRAYMVITSDFKLTDENFLFRKESALTDVMEDYVQMIIARKGN